MLDSKIITDLYDAALSPNIWRETLDRLCPLMGARSASILVVDKFNEAERAPYSVLRLSSVYNTDITEEYMTEYASYEADHVNATLNSTPGTMVRDPASENRQTYLKRPDVAFLHKHLNIADRIGIRLNKESEFGDFLAFQYPLTRPVSNSQEFSQLQPYLEHVAQAVTSARLYDSIRLRYRAVLSMLDRVRVGMIVVRHDGSIIVKNQTANETLDNTNLFSVTTAGRLEIANASSQNLLLKAIRDVSTTALGNGDSVRQYVNIGDDLHDNKMLLEVTPLRDPEGEIQTGAIGAFIMVIDPNRDASLNTEALTHLFGLTPAENELANMIAQGKSNQEMSDRRNVCGDTVKTQLRSLYAKTNSTNRSSLLRRLYSIALPFED